MNVLKMPRTPPVIVESTCTVMAAVESMARERVGACLVLESGKLAGLFSERDLMVRVVNRKLDPATTRVADVMTRELKTVKKNVTATEALTMMLENHIRHLPVVDDGGKILALLSIRNLLQHRVEELAQQVHSMEMYMGADGPGG
jgi:CBS domain-containing protein